MPRWLIRTTVVPLAAFLVLAAGVPATVQAARGWYTAPDGCPSAGRFAALVTRRRSDVGAEGGRPTAASASFMVTIRRTGQGLTGRVQPRQDDTRRDAMRIDARVLRSDSCEDLADALALVVALGMRTPEAADEKASAGDTSKGPAQLPVAGTSAAEAPPPAALEIERAAPQDPRPDAWALGAGAELRAVLGVPMPGVALFVERRRAAFEAWGWPDARLGLVVATTDIMDVGASKARFLIANVALDVCPVGASLPSAIALRICALGRAGWIRGTGTEIERPRTATLPWTAVGLDARVRHALGPHSFVGFRLGASTSLLRPAFVFETPRETVAEVARVAWEAGVDVGFAIP